MNNTYFGNNGIGQPLYTPTPNQTFAPEITVEPDYMESLLHATEKLKVKIYATYSDSIEWRDRVYSGILEASGRDYVAVSDPSTGRWYIIPIIYVDYYEFEEDLTKFLNKKRTF